MDCKEGKELKQSTCRYVKKCKPGWTRNEKFICRKTTRRLHNSPNLQELYETKQREELTNFQTPRNPRTSRKQTFLNEPAKTKKTRTKTKVGNYITYTHPDGRKERSRVTGIQDGKYELHIPSLGDEWVKQGAPRFKKGETVYFMYRTGMREKSIVKKVINGGEMYEVFLTMQQVTKTVPEKKLRKLDSFEGTFAEPPTPSYFKQDEMVHYIHSNGTKEDAQVKKVINGGKLYQVYLFADDELITVGEGKLRKINSFTT